MASRLQSSESQVRMAASSHIGASARRTLLEDRSRAERLTTAGGITMALGIVADGIGGENAGERAAELTVQTVLDECRASTQRSIPLLLEAALQRANRRVYQEARRSQRKTNMGSTAAVAAVVDGKLYSASVGDSRVYLLRGRKAFPLTIDHTWENEVVGSGKLSRLEAAKHPRKDEIVRSIGYQPELEVDLGLWLHGGSESAAEARAAQGLPLERGDVVLICSDGLIKSRHDRPGEAYVEVSEFNGLIRGKSPKRAADDLIKRALSRKVDDNVSAVILEVPGPRHLVRTVGPRLGLGAAAALALGAVVWGVPRLLGDQQGPRPAPTIPALPSGVAFVSEIGGRAELQRAGGVFEALQAEALVAAGPQVVLRVVGPSSYLRLGLADKSIVYLGPDGQVELARIGSAEAGQASQLALERGLLLVASQGGAIQIQAPSGLIAQLQGGMLGAAWDEASGQFEVDCFQPTCEVLFLGGVSMGLLPGQHVAISLGGEVIGPVAIDPGRYDFAGYAGGLVAAPTGALAGDRPTATRTPLGPLFVSPTPRPLPTITPKPPEEGPPPPEPTQVPPTPVPPTSTPVPPTAPPPTNTPIPQPTNTTAPQPSSTSAPPTEPPEPTEEPEPTAEDGATEEP